MERTVPQTMPWTLTTETFVPRVLGSNPSGLTNFHAQTRFSEVRTSGSRRQGTASEGRRAGPQSSWRFRAIRLTNHMAKMTAAVLRFVDPRSCCRVEQHSAQFRPRRDGDGPPQRLIRSYGREAVERRGARPEPEADRDSGAPHAPALENMNMPTTVFRDLVAEAPIPARGILSQTLSNEQGIELVLFALAAGEQLSEHTSAHPAIIHILAGEADLTVGADAHRAIPGTWVRMPAGTRHSVIARTALVMALYLLPRDEAAT
jgi:quercetin dioxygenase-like cupin family protein